MPHDAFISYASRDKLKADAVCHRLEAAGIRCWIAPRDVPGGAVWASEIPKAIRASRVMVLIFSANANESEHVQREVHLAFNHKKTVIPLRVEDVPPTAGLEYYLVSVHWLDALTPPLERHIGQVVEEAKRLLAPPDVAVAPPVPPIAQPADLPAFPGGIGQPHFPVPAGGGGSRRSKTRLILAGLVVLALGAGGWFWLHGGGVPWSGITPASPSQISTPVLTAEDSRQSALRREIEDGNDAFDLGNYEKALAAYQHALALDAHSLEATAGVEKVRVYAQSEAEKGGSLMDPNPELAPPHLRTAAALGNAYAQARLGYMYELGLGGLNVDIAKAVELYQQAAEQGDIQGQASLGSLYERGIGVPLDHRKAAALYRKAAEQGSQWAKDRLKALGVPVP